MPILLHLRNHATHRTTHTSSRRRIAPHDALIRDALHASVEVHHCSKLLHVHPLAETLVSTVECEDVAVDGA